MNTRPLGTTGPTVSAIVRVEHAVEGFKAIPGAELAVIASASHFVLYSQQERVIPIVKHFLEKPEKDQLSDIG